MSSWDSRFFLHWIDLLTALGRYPGVVAVSAVEREWPASSSVCARVAPTRPQPMITKCATHASSSFSVCCWINSTGHEGPGARGRGPRPRPVRAAIAAAVQPSRWPVQAVMTSGPNQTSFVWC